MSSEKEDAPQARPSVGSCVGAGMRVGWEARRALNSSRGIAVVPTRLVQATRARSHGEMVGKSRFMLGKRRRPTLDTVEELLLQMGTHVVDLRARVGKLKATVRRRRCVGQSKQTLLASKSACNPRCGVVVCWSAGDVFSHACNAERRSRRIGTMGPRNMG